VRQTELKTLLDGLLKSGRLENCAVLTPSASVRWWKARKIVAAVAGDAVIAEHTFRLRIGLQAAFPLCLPDIGVEKVDPPCDLPHTYDDEWLCYEPDTGLLLDRRTPQEVLYEALELAIARLGETLTKPPAIEYLQELPAYWRRLASGTDIDCVIQADERARPCIALLNSGKLFAVADDSRSYGRSLAGRSATFTEEKAFYLPVDPFKLRPEFTPRNLLDLTYLRALIRANGHKSRAVEDQLARFKKREELAVLGVLRPDGHHALVGIQFRRIVGGYPLLDDKGSAEVKPVNLLRRDRDYLAPRGGASDDLANTRVLMAGCGAVGGHIALMLARAGVGHMTLFDSDVFARENFYRHVCAMAHQGKPKALGLKAEIERLVPFVTIEAHPDAIESSRDFERLLGEHALVISAMGNPTVELWLNETLWSTASNPPALFAWVEPLGIGGHVLVTHESQSGHHPPGCFECLHGRRVAGGPLENRAAFADPSGRYSRDLLGCGSRHIPFADLDAVRTAELACRLAVRCLRGENQVHPLVSWRGDPQPFVSQGYKLTPRFSRAEPNEIDRASLAISNCPVCSGAGTR
jgi:hypothetical protein